MSAASIAIGLPEFPCNPALSVNCNEPLASESWHGTQFMLGLPMKPATNRFAGWL